MHGIIHAELRKFVTTTYDEATWDAVLAEAKLPGKIYTPLATYPDADVVGIVGAASRLTGLPASAILEKFGEFIAPDLLELYRSLIDPSWTVLDLLERTEGTIHRVVRLRNPGAEPPRLKTFRTSKRALRIEYSSPRGLCAVAKGIVQGMSRQMGQPVTITETHCMQDGEAACELTVTV